MTSKCRLTFLFFSPPLFADYVYFENSSSNPLLIRRIEELNKVSYPDAHHNVSLVSPNDS